MIQEIERLIDIVSKYRQAVAEYHDTRRQLEKQARDGVIGSLQLKDSIKKLDTGMETRGNRDKEEYEAEYAKAIEAARKAISSPKFAADTGFRNVVETIKNSSGAFDTDPDVLRGMMSPYLEDYAARKILAATLDKFTALKSRYFNIHAANPLYALQSLAGREVLEFNNWASEGGTAFRGLLGQLQAVLDIAKGESSTMPSTSIVF